MRFASAARSSFVRSVGHFSSAIIIGVLSMQTSYAGPEGGQVVRGNGNIVRPNTTTTNINQHTQNIAIDWQSFNVSQNETVNFYQPNSTATALNRIFDQNASEIFGTINTNGRVILVNANGIYFGQSAAVNVGALIASGMDINPDAFMNGDWTFANSDGSTGGLIVNHGLLQAAEGGSVSLFGGGVQNTGTILANYGSINLAAGEQVTIDFDGDGLIQFAVDGELLENAYGLDAAVSNSGTLRADSGRVLLSAASANDVFAQVVNNEGVIQANGVTTDGGRVFLTGSGGDVVNTGSITATSETGMGGEVRLLGDRVGLFGDALVDVSGATGGGTVLIGGDYQGGDGVQTASRTAVGTNAVIRADAMDVGNGGKVIIWSDDTTRFLGTISARGGVNAGDGGFVEVSGKEYLEYRGDVDTSAVNGAIGTLLLDPADIVIAGGTGGTDDGAITGDGQALFADGTGTFTISEDAMESTDSNIILEATNGITTSGTFDNDETGEGAGVLILQNNRSLTLRTRNAATEGSGGIDLTTSVHGNDLEVRTRGTGSITLTAGTDGGDAGSAGITVGHLTTASGTIDTGSIILTAEGDININGAVTTGNAQDTNNDQASGALSITSSTGGITVAATGSLSTGNAQANSNNNSATSGALTLSAASNIVLNGAVTAGTATTNDDLATGGAISITSTGGSVATNVGASLATGVVSGDDTGASTSGNIAVAGASGVNIGETVTTGGVTSLDDAGHSGDISLSSSAGSVISSATLTTGAVTGDDQASTSGDITIASDTGVTLGATAATGSVTLAANAVSVTSGLIDIGSTTSGDINVTGLTTGAATTTAAGGDATSGGITLNAAGAIAYSGALQTGLAVSATQDAVSGNIDMTASAGGVSGGGTAGTGNATGDGNGVGEFATVGDITVTATGNIQLSAANALATGAGELTDDAGGNDNINLGDIALSGAAISSDGVDGQLQVAFGNAVRANADATINRGVLAATTTGGAGDAGGIFATSATDMYVGALATDAGAAQNVNISTTGGANLVVTDTVETLSGDAVTLDAGAGVLTVDDTAFALGAGSLTAIGEEINFNGGAGSISGTGNVVLHASNIATNVRVGDSAGAAGRLDITDTDLAALAGGFNGITIGRADSTATLTTDALGVLFSDAITLEMSAGNIVLEGNVLTAGEAITLNAVGIELGAVGGVSIDATNGGAAAAGANIVLNGATADAGNDSSFTVNAGTGGTLDLGNVVTGLGQTYTANNIDLNGTTYQSTTSGAITFNGTVDLDNGGTTTVQTAGVLSTDDIVFSSSIDGASALVLQAGSGDIDIANGIIGGATPLTSLTVTSANTLAIGTATTAGVISLTATTIDGSSSDIALTSNTGSIDVTGNVTTAGNAVDITAATGVTTVGSIATAAAADSGLASGSVSIDVTGAGNISIGAIDTSGADSTAAGVDGGAGGAVTIATTNGTVTVADITSSGGFHNELTDTPNSGGAAGAIGITSGGANDITLNGQLVARGGTTSDASGTAGAGTTVTLSSGANIVVGNAVDPDINAGALSLTAAGNGGTLTTQVETLTANADTGFSITNTGNVTATLTAANGTATLANTGTLATGGAWAADAFDVDATGAITLDHTITSDNGNVDVASSAALTTVNAAVTSSAQALVSGVGVTNSATITGNTGVTVNAGTGTFTNTSSATEQGILSNGGSAAGIMIVADAADLQTGGVAGDSQVNGGTGTVSIQPFTNGTALNLGVATGALDISSAEAQTVTAATLALGDATDTGTVTLDQFDAGTLDVSITGTSIDDIDDAATHLTTTGNATLTATTGAIGATGVGLVVDVAGIAATTSNQNITLAAIDFDEDTTNASPANLAVGATGITSGGGNVVLNVADDVTLTGAINAGTGAVTIAAGAASLDNATADGVASVNGAGLVTGSSIDIDAVSGIGNSVALNTASTSIAADTTAGALDINNTSAGDATVTTLSSGDSSVTFDQSGGGDLLLGSVTAATTATLSSANGINDDAVDTTTDVTATTVALSAGTGIGNTADVDLAATSISATSTAGAIALNSAATAGTTVTNLSTDSASITFAQTGGQTLDIAAATTSTSGDITISNDNAALTAGSGAGIASAGNVALTTTTGGDIVLADVSGTTVTVTSAGAINDGVAVAPVVTATDLALSAQTGIANLDIDATTVAATTVSGNLELIDANALEIGTVGALSGVAISAGAVGDDIGITTGTALTATGVAADDIDNQFGDISLVAGTSIGASGTPVLVELDPLNGVLNLDAGSDIYVASTSDLDLGSVVTGVGAHDVSVAITSTAASLGLTQAIDAGVNAGLSGDNLIFSIAGTSLPTAPVNDSTFDNNGFTIDVDAGSLSVTADTINLAGTIEATGNISVAAADEGSTIGLGNAGSAAVAGQNFVLTNGTLLTLLGASGGSLTVGSASAGNVVMDGVDISTITSGTLHVVTGSTVADDDLTAGHGFVGGLDDTLRITSNGVIGVTDGLSVNAGAIDVVSSGGNNIDLDIFTDHANVELSAVTGGAGNIDVTQNTDTVAGFRNLRIDNIDTTGTVTIINNTGSISESSISGDAGVDIAGSSIVLTASGGVGAGTPLETATTDITATSLGGTILLNNDATGLGAVSASLSSSTNIGFTQIGGESLALTSASAASGVVVSNDADITATSVSSSNAATNVTLTTTGSGDVFLGAVSAPGTVTVNSAGAIEESGADATADVSAASIDLNGGTGIGALAAIELAGTTISADTTAGAVDLANNNAADVTLSSLSSGDSSVRFAQSNTGNLLIGAVNAATSATLSSAAAINDAAADGVTDITAATVDLDAVSGIGNTAALELAATSISADTASGNIDFDNTSATDATLSSATTGSGNVTVDQTGTGDLLISNVVATTTATLTSAASIEEAGADAGADISAATLLMTAGTGIGAVGAIETSALDITASNVTGGAIDLANSYSTGLANVSLTTDSGNITFTQADSDATEDLEMIFNATTTTSGDISATHIGSNVGFGQDTVGGISSAGAFSATQTSTTGDLYLGDVSATTSATVTTNRSIIDWGVDAATDVTAATIDIDAGTGIGVDVASASISADTTTGNIDLSNTATAASVVSSISTGTGTITLAQTGGRTLTVTSAVTTSGAIGITNTDADIVLDAVTAGGTANVTASTLTSGDIFVGNIAAAGDTISLTSAGAIDESGSDAGVDATSATLNLSAATGIGASGTLEVGATTLSATTTTGNIDLANTATSASSITLDTGTGAGTGSIDFDQTGGFGATVTATTDDGAIDISNDSGNLTLSSVTAGGSNNVTGTTTTSGNILVGAINASGDTVTLTSAGAINDLAANPDAVTDITAATVDLNAITGIGNTASLELAATSIAADTNDGNIDIDNVSAAETTLTSVTTGTGNIDVGQAGGGGLRVDLVSATTGNVTLASANTLDETAVQDGAVDISASGLVTLTATGGLGALAAPEISAGSLALTNNGMGDLAVAIVGDINIGAGGITNNAAGGGLDLTAINGSINVGTSNLATSGGDISLTARDDNEDNSNGTPANISMTTGSISTGAGGGNIVLTAGDDITLGSGAINAGTGTLTIAAGDLASDNGTVETVPSGALSGTGTWTASSIALSADTGISASNLRTTSVSADSNTGAVTIANDSAGNVTLSSLTSGDDAVSFTQTNTGSILVGSVSAATTATLTSAAAINDAALDAITDITAATIDLDAITGIGNGDALELAGTAISADTVNGNIALSNAATAATTASSLTTGTGTISFTQTGNQSLAVTTATTGSGGIAFSNTGGNLALGAVTAGGVANINATTLTSGDILLGDVTAAGDTVTLTSAGAIEESGTDADDDITAATVTLGAVTGIGDAATLETNASSITATTTNGDIDLSNSFAGAVTVSNLQTGTGAITFAQTGAGTLGVTAATTTSGAIDVSNVSGDLTLTSLSAGGASNVTASTTTSGSILVGAINAAGDTVALTSAGAINDAALDAITDITAATIDLDAITGIGNGDALELAGTAISADTVNGNIALSNAATAATTASSLTTGTGTISFTQTGNQSLAVTTATTGSGGIAFSNTGGNLALGAVTAGGVANINATTLTSGDILLGDVTAAGDTVTLTSAGAIEESGTDADDDITAATVTLGAVTGIGDAATLETNASSITATTTNGDIDLSNSFAGAVTVNNLQTGTGAITFAQTGAGTLGVTAATTTSGAIDVSNVSGDLTLTSLSAGGASNVTASTTTSGSILVGAINAAGDTVALTSAGAINDAALDAITDITAATIDLDAITGIGNGDALELAGTAISANTTAGNIDIDNASATAATFSTVATGAGAVSIDQTGGGNMLLGDVSGTTTVSLSSTAAIEESGTDAGADVSGATINLAASTGIGAAATLETSGTSINAGTVNGDIDLANIATAATITTLDTGTGAGTGSITFAQTGGFSLDVTSAVTDNGAITLGNTGGNLALTSVTAGGANNVNATTTTSGDITATSVNAAGDIVTLGSAGAIVTGNITAATLNATSDGTITDDNLGAIAVTGTTTLDSNDNTITLDEANNFGTVAITSGSNVTLRDANSINLGAAAVSGTYDVTANAIDVTGAVAANAIDFDVSGGAGDIVDSTGTLTVATTSTLLAGAANSITLDGLNDFNTVIVDNAVAGNDANNVTLNDINAVVLGTTTIAGTLDVTAVGNITTSGNLAGAGFVLDSTTGSLTLDNTLAAGASGVDLDAATTMTINQAIGTTGGGTVDLQSTGLMSFGVNGDITSTGTVGVTSTGAAITMADGTVFTTSGVGSSVALTADTNVALGRINSSSTVTVNATNGVITDITAGEGIGNENIVGTVVTLNADTGIGTFSAGGGHAGDIDIDGEQLSATLASDGNIGIFETDDIYLVSVDAGLTAGNSLIIEAGGSINDHAGDQLSDVTADIGELIAGGDIGGAPMNLLPDGDLSLDTDITNQTLAAVGSTNVLDVGFGTVNLSFDNDADFTYASLNRNIEIGFIDASGVNINDVTITTNNGWIRDDGADAIDILATGVITLSARDGIGVDETGTANGTLNLAAATIDLQTTSNTNGEGDIAVAIDADAIGTAITVTNLIAGNNAGAATGTVSVTQTGSQSLTVNNVDAAGGVDISNAGGTLATTGTISNITGGGVDLAADGINVDGVITTAGAFVADSTSAVAITDDVSADSMDIDADTTLDINATLATTAGGAIALDAVGLTSLELGGAINSGGTVTFGATDAGPVDLGGAITTTNDAVTFGGAVNLVAAASIDTGLGGGNVTFDAAVDGAQVLGITAGTGSVTFSGDVGAGTALTSLNVTGGAVGFAGGITTSGATAITNSGLLALGVGDAVSAGGGFTQGGAGTVSLGSDITTSTDNITFAGAVTLTDDIVLDTGAGATVGFGGAITGGTNDLTVTNAGGGTQFAGASGLGALSVTGTTTSTGSIDATSIALNGNTSLGANVGLEATTGGVTITGALALTGGGTSTIETSGSQDIVVTGNVTGSHGLTMNAGRNITIGGGTGIVSLSSGTATFGIDADGGSGGASLNANSITANAVAISGSGDDILNVNNIAATSGVTFSALQLGRNLTVNSGSFDANGTLTGARTLAVNATGNAEFETISNLTGIAVNASNISFNNAVSVGGGGVNAIASNAVNLGADVTSSGSAITLGGDVILGGDVAISTGGGAGAITIADSVTGSADDLTLTAGTGAITLGDVDGVSQLDLNSSGAFTLTGAIDVGTFDADGLSGSMRVDGSGSIDTANSAIDLSTVSSINGNTAGADSLSLDAGSADVTLVAIGSSTRLASFAVRGGSIDARAVSTTGGQTFNGDLVTSGNLDSTGGALDINGNVLLGSNTTMRGSGVDISGDVDGTRSLNLVASGNVRVGGGIGQDETQRVQSLSIDSATATVQAVTTNGSQSYDTNLTANGDLTSHNGALSFDGSLAVNGGITVTGDTVNLRGGDSSVTGNANSSLTLLPFTDARNIVVGSSGNDALVLSGNALDGFGGDLYIGGASADLYGSPVTAGVEIAAGTISVNEGITVGGNLALLSTGGITLVDGRLTAGGNLLLVANSAGAQIRNEGEAETMLMADTVLLVSRGQVGEEGSDIVVSAGTRSVQLATEASSAFIQGRDEDLNPSLANLIARAVGVNPNVNVQVQSSAQTSANREQSSGLADEGFIDPSLFEDIALYEVSGSGIALPSDQSEEEVFDDGPADDCNTEEQNCELEATGAVGVVSPH